MSSSLDRHAARDLNPRRQLADAEQGPADLLWIAAGLLENYGHASSEARATADKLRRLARALAAAQRAEQAGQRHDGTFGGDR
jgi:hypothetical protein